MPRAPHGVLGHRHREPGEQARRRSRVSSCSSCSRGASSRSAPAASPGTCRSLDREQLRLEPRGQPGEPEAPQHGRGADLHRRDLEPIAVGAQDDVADADHAPAVEVDDLPVEERLAQPGRLAGRAAGRRRRCRLGRPGRQRGVAPLGAHGDDPPRLVRLDDAEIAAGARVAPSIATGAPKSVLAMIGGVTVAPVRSRCLGRSAEATSRAPGVRVRSHDHGQVALAASVIWPSAPAAPGHRPAAPTRPSRRPRPARRRDR